jgi:hypothetical protein
MSVRTSPANIEPPPLLFGQRSPSPPSFTSPPLSPNHIQPPQSPLTSHPLQQHIVESMEDVDMTTSITLQPPTGQNHDREDAAMDGVEPSSGAVRQLSESESEDSSHGSDTASNVEMPSADAMETDEAVLQTTQSQVANTNTASDQPAASATDNEQTPSVTQIQLPYSEGVNTNTGTADSDSNTTVTAADPLPTAQPSDVSNGAAPVSGDQPPPPPPNVDGARTDESSSDEEDEVTPRWHPIQEDTSTPDERELKEIEETTEYSATDRK